MMSPFEMLCHPRRGRQVVFFFLSLSSHVFVQFVFTPPPPPPPPPPPNVFVFCFLSFSLARVYALYVHSPPPFFSGGGLFPPPPPLAGEVLPSFPLPSPLFVVCFQKEVPLSLILLLFSFSIRMLCSLHWVCVLLEIHCWWLVGFLLNCLQIFEWLHPYFPAELSANVWMIAPILSCWIVCKCLNDCTHIFLLNSLQIFQWLHLIFMLNCLQIFEWLHPVFFIPLRLLEMVVLIFNNCWISWNLFY